ncbi:MAG: hypothetical protein BWY71_00710 [Planctomycetes bacterium ADurb.Bin412]|nr:MAG: hypothetical protein BWY71_00710 [Planctomycetes bacterium ADurb.Bin412]
MVKKLIFVCIILFTLVFCVSPAGAGALKGHWKLDTDPNMDPPPADPNVLLTAVDELGLNHGRLIDDPNWITGVTGGTFALQFDGTNYVDMGYYPHEPNTPDLNMGTGNVSITAWVKFGYLPPSQLPDGTPLPGHGIIAGKGIMSNDNGYGLIALDTGQVCFQVREDNISYREAYSNDTDGNWIGFVNDEQWHHVVGVLEREQENGTRIYVDGVLQTHYFTDAVSTIGWTYNLDSDTAPFCIGARRSDIMPEGHIILWWLKGEVDDVQVYDYALTQENIDFLYANPGVPITVPTCGAWGYQAMDFDKNCYVDLADLAAFAADWMKCTDPADSVHCIQVN